MGISTVIPNGIVVVKTHGAPLEPLHVLEDMVQKGETGWVGASVESLEYSPDNYWDGMTGGSRQVRARVSLDDLSLVRGLLRDEERVLPGGMVVEQVPAGMQTQLWFVAYALPDFARRVRMIVDGSMRSSKLGQNHHYVVASHVEKSEVDTRFMKDSKIHHEQRPSWEMLRSVAAEFGWPSE
jgi:hypothetical protein